MSGRNDWIQFLDEIKKSDSLAAAESWDLLHGWRCGLMLSNGKTLLMSPRAMRKLADAFAKGLERDGMTGLTPVIAPIINDMRDCARIVKAKNLRRMIPDDMVKYLQPAGNA
jgi:hypothetical protein